MKTLKIVIFLMIIESIFFLRNASSNLELFFMVWSFIFLAILIYSIFNVKSDGSIAEISSGQDNSLLSTIFLEKVENTRGGTKVENSINKGNLSLLVLLLVNIIGYLVVMPK